MLSIKVHLVFLSIFSVCQSVRFRGGSCPIPPMSSGDLPKTSHPLSLVLLAPLTGFSSIDAPSFSKRIIGGQKCIFEYSQAADKEFIVGYQEQCMEMNGTIIPNKDGATYDLNYQFYSTKKKNKNSSKKGQTRREESLPECTRNWLYSNRVFIYSEDDILIFWVCFDNRPEIGSHDEAVAAFANGSMEEKDYLVLTVNQLTFSKLTIRNFLNRIVNNCTDLTFPCPEVKCPLPRESWRNNLGVVIWLACFAVVSFVSSSFCGVLKSRRKRNENSRRRILVQQRQMHVQAWQE